jgi:hypothetical protein
MSIDIEQLQNTIYMKNKIAELYDSDISSTKIFSISVKWLEKGYTGLREYKFVTNAPIDFENINQMIKDNKDIKKILSIDIEPIDYFKK